MDIDQTPIETLVGQCIKGDRRSQEQLFEKYKNLFYALAYKLLGPRFEIDDVVQQIFIQIFRSLPSFGGRSAFETWIYRIGINVCTAELRKKFRKRKLETVPLSEEVEHTSADPAQGAHMTLEQRDLEKKIYEMLDKLHVKKRIVVVMHDMEEKRLEDIAEIIGKPVGTVKSRLFHGREELKKMLSKYVER